MDPVFDAQLHVIKDDFSTRGVRLNVMHTPAGVVDYVHETGHLLAMGSDDSLSRLSRLLPGIRPADRAQPRSRDAGGLVVLTLDDLQDGSLTVSDALELLEIRQESRDRDAVEESGLPLATPNHLMHITRLCPAVEPEVPEGVAAAPWPAPRPPGPTVRDVRIGVCDTGLLEGLDLGAVPWLAGVTGEPDPLPPPLPNGVQRIPSFAGHGTFIAGVARCLAPQSDVVVTDHFTTSGAQLESVLVDEIEELAATGPDVICLSAGTYTRGNWTSLGFADFHQRFPEVTLVAAAGNESTDRPFYPAAYDWVVAAGALGADQQHRAWFSNYGDWVDLYVLGEGLVNAYATGEYVYTEPPKRPARQTFRGMARWSGTSFSAPVVAGMIADRMARTGRSSVEATSDVLAAAATSAVDGVGPALPIDVEL